IVRRYMCSYNSPDFLFPPYELLQLAACVKAWNNAEVTVIDAIALSLSEADVIARIKTGKPDIVVSLTGIESIATDLAVIDLLKRNTPGVTFAAFGYYPTIFAEEILKKTSLDMILRNEPEESFSTYLTARMEGSDVAKVKGVALRDAAGRIIANPDERISDLDKLPFADYSLVRGKKYGEMLLGGPLGVIQSSRGCPFQCTYCITTHGRKAFFKTAGRVVEEIKNLAGQGIHFCRFIDDTFNVDKQRVRDICEGIIREKVKMTWSCLSRVDTLDEDVLRLMKKSGCVRVYVGIESYSQKVIDYFKKGYRCSEINDRLQLIRKAGLESAGFVIVGSPYDDYNDYTETLFGVLGSPLDFLIATKLVPYPGTPLFEKEKDKIIFELMPYRSTFMHEVSSGEVIRLEKEIYRRFYFRPRQMMRLLKVFMRSPFQSIMLLMSFVKFLGKKADRKEHPDFL
ncbi:MAG: radical SAM protein, partial [Candidatus Omnitrophica bacterium]|nr:radical SAM protein [Candidatus Omnitrophota bacterium]